MVTNMNVVIQQKVVEQIWQSCGFIECLNSCPLYWAPLTKELETAGLVSYLIHAIKDAFCCRQCGRWCPKDQYIASSLLAKKNQSRACRTFASNDVCLRVSPLLSLWCQGIAWAIGFWLLPLTHTHTHTPSLPLLSDHLPLSPSLSKCCVLVVLCLMLFG